MYSTPAQVFITLSQPLWTPLVLCAQQGRAVTVSAAHHWDVPPSVLPWGNKGAQRAAAYGVTSGWWCSGLGQILLDVWTWTHLRKFASGGPKSGGDPESLKNGRFLDLGRFECVSKHRTSNKGKCCLLLLAQGNLGCTYREGRKKLEYSPAGGVWGFG